MSRRLMVFSAEWCSNCKPYKQMLKSRGIEFDEIDVETDEGRALGAQFGVRALPTSAVMDGEVPVYIVAGTGSIDRVIKELNG